MTVNECGERWQSFLQSLVNSSTQWYQQVLYVQSKPYKQSPKTTCPDKNIINLQRKSREKIITLWCIWVHVWNVWKIPLTARIAESGLDCCVIQPCSVYTGVPSLCQPQASYTKASPDNVKRVCVCVFICGCVCVCARTSDQPADICSFEGSQIADNRLSKQSRSSGSQFSSTVNRLQLCQICDFVLC